MKADVTEGSAKLADAISDDSDAVVCATGFRPSLDLFAPWKVGELNFYFLSCSMIICVSLNAFHLLL